MPIEFSPPQANLNYQIAPPQYTDPLQTLAQMGQIKNQNLQRQGAEQELEMNRAKLDSQKGMLRAMVESRGDMKKFESLISQPGYNVLPGDALTYQEHRTKLEQDIANRDETANKVRATNLDLLRGQYAGVTDEAGLAAAHARADKLQIPANIPRYEGPFDPTHLSAFSAGLAGESQLIKEAQEKAATQASLAATASSQATQRETGFKTEALEKAAIAQELQNAETDASGRPTPAAMAEIQANHPRMKLPPPNKEAIDKFIRSVVPAEKQPEFDIKQAEAAAIKAYAATSPQDLDAQVDAIMPPDNPMNASTKSLLHGAISRGDFPEVKKIFKDAYDQIGRVQAAVATAKATAPIKIDVATATAGAKADAAGLTEDDYNRAGEQYIRTGVMPAVGRDSLTRNRIVKAGNQWARDNHLSPSDVTIMQAAYAGDKDSLKKFQAQRDQIVSFEQTAQKNLDLFLDLAGKIPDTGVPWLNRPIRSLTQSMVGSENMAAVNAARQIANNEIAKVTSGGGLSGVLSDSARHEVASYNPDNATFAQTKAVANILKQDMANRHGSMDATLSEIKSRISGGTNSPAEPPAGGNAPQFIKVGNKRYKYKGSGARNDLNNYTEVPNK